MSKLAPVVVDRAQGAALDRAGEVVGEVAPELSVAAAWYRNSARASSRRRQQRKLPSVGADVPVAGACFTRTSSALPSHEAGGSSAAPPAQTWTSTVPVSSIRAGSRLDVEGEGVPALEVLRARRSRCRRRIRTNGRAPAEDAEAREARVGRGERPRLADGRGGGLHALVDRPHVEQIDGRHALDRALVGQASVTMPRGAQLPGALADDAGAERRRQGPHALLGAVDADGVGVDVGGQGAAHQSAALAGHHHQLAGVPVSGMR